MFATVTDRDTFLASTSNRQRSSGVSPENFVGMDLETFTQQLADNLGIKHVDGVYVTRVYPGSPADRASISAGTIIMQVNNEPVKSVQDIHAIARQLDGTSTRIPLIVQEPDGQFAKKVVRP
jgi:serine protease Do